MWLCACGRVQPSTHSSLQRVTLAHLVVVEVVILFQTLWGAATHSDETAETAATMIMVPRRTAMYIYSMECGFRKHPPAMYIYICQALRCTYT